MRSVVVTYDHFENTEFSFFKDLSFQKVYLHDISIHYVSYQCIKSLNFSSNLISFYYWNCVAADSVITKYVVFVDNS